MTRRFASASTALVLLSLTTGAQPAGAAKLARLSCGETIKTDTKLANNLTDCENNGIVIGADGVRLDLNGHKVDGDNKLVATCEGNVPCENGILALGHDDVVITGGTVRQFGTGVAVLRARDVEVRRLAAVRNIFNGLLVFQSSRSRIVESRATRNGVNRDFPGIAVVESKRIGVAQTTSRHSGDIGLWVVESRRNRFAHNRITDNPEAGITVDGARTLVRGNLVARNGDAILLGGDRNTVARNEIRRAQGCGGGCGVGISVEDGRGNRVAGNEIRGAREFGIRISTFVAGQHLRDTTVRRNSVRGAGRVGILVGPKAGTTLLSRNHVRRAGNDGIAAESPATTLIRNHAFRNGRLGIAAVSGAIDGGGNEAGANGDPAQCENVLCG